MPPIPLVSLIPVANNENYQAADTVNLQKKAELEEKIILYVDSNTQRCSNKKCKHFLIEDLLICQIATNVNDTVLMEYSGAVGKLIFEKNLKSKIS